MKLNEHFKQSKSLLFVSQLASHSPLPAHKLKVDLAAHTQTSVNH